MLWVALIAVALLVAVAVYAPARQQLMNWLAYKSNAPHETGRGTTV